MNKWIFLGAALSFSTAVLAHQGATGHGHAHQAAASHGVTTADFEQAELNSAVQAEQCWVRLLPGTVPSAAYFQLQNKGQNDATLVAVRSFAHDDVMVHETTHKDGMSHMGHIANVVIPAGQTVSFAPGGLHVMLEQANQPLQQGGKIELELLYADHSKTLTHCELRSPKTQSY